MQLKQSQSTNNIPSGGSTGISTVNFQQYNYQYYEEYKRLYQTAFLLSLQLKQLGKCKEDAENKLAKIQKKGDDFKDDLKGANAADKKKRFRRTAETIQRRFVCEVDRCHKCYGSDGSLQQHIKLKHPQLYQSKSQHRKQEENENSPSEYEESLSQEQEHSS